MWDWAGQVVEQCIYKPGVIVMKRKRIFDKEVCKRNERYNV